MSAWDRPVPALGGVVELVGHYLGAVKPHWRLSDAGRAYYDCTEGLERAAWVATVNRCVEALWRPLSLESRRFAIEVAPHWTGTVEGLVQLCLRTEQDFRQGVEADAA